MILNFGHNSKTKEGEPAWGTVDKTALPELAFAGKGENKSDWSYPHHWISGGTERDDRGIWTNGTMYLHEGGLNAAWSAANGGRSGQKAEQSILDHLQAHRKALGKDDAQDRLRRYSITAQAAGEAEIWIYEEIGDSWFGGVSAKQFVDDLKALGDLHTINLHINSPGGSVFDAVAIYNVLKGHKAAVNVSIEGLAASSASIVAMAGDRIEMANNAMLMIHDPWTVSIGAADDLRRDADMLDKVKGTILQTYLNQCMKTGKKDMRDRLMQMMSDETWMSAYEAMECGLVDAIVEELQAAAACFDLSRFKYRKVPSALIGASMNTRSRLASLNLKCHQIRTACGSVRAPAPHKQ
jgi:ATP-dependent Clp protease protease subunit